MEHKNNFRGTNFFDKTKTRIIAIKVAYQREKIGISVLGEEFLLKDKLVERDKIFVDSIIQKFFQKKEQINSLIQKFLIGWKQERIDDILNIILQIALAEKFVTPNLPVQILLNEYLHITRFFAGEKAVKMCNAVLMKCLDDSFSQKC